MAAQLSAAHWRAALGLFQDTGVAVMPGAGYSLSMLVGEQLSPGAPLIISRILIGYGGHDLATTTVFADSGNIINTTIGRGMLGSVSATGKAPAGASGDLWVFLLSGSSGETGIGGTAFVGQRVSQQCA